MRAPFTRPQQREANPMMTIRPDEANRVLVIEFRGMISEADVDRAYEDLEDRYPEISVRLPGGTRGPIGVLVDWEHLIGWERGAKTWESSRKFASFISKTATRPGAG